MEKKNLSVADQASGVWGSKKMKGIFGVCGWV